MSDEELLAPALRTLRGGSPLSSEELGALSHLTGTDLDLFRRAWRETSGADRGRVLTQLQAAERESRRYDFSAVYRFGFQEADPAVRRQAVESIVEPSSDEALPELARLATDDPDVDVREAACRALAPFALMAELGELPLTSSSLVTHALLTVLRKPDEAIGPRREAVAALGYLDTAAVADEIRQRFADPELRLNALRAMGRSANPTWLGVLSREASNPDSSVRREVAQAFGEMADQRALEVVTDMVDDPVLAVRLAAIAALGEIGGDEARDALIYTLEDKRSAIREAAQSALAALDFDEDPLAL